MEAQEWKFESPYPPAARLLIISCVTHGEGACVCVCLCLMCVCGPSLPGWQGQGVWWQGIWGSDSTGKVVTSCNTLFVLHRRVSADVVAAAAPLSLNLLFKSPEKHQKSWRAKESYLQNTGGGMAALDCLTRKLSDFTELPHYHFKTNFYMPSNTLKPPFTRF